MNITGNVISGQVTGDTAKQLSERFGKIMQDGASFSINTMDTSASKSTHPDGAIPVSTIAFLSSEEFVGIVADNPDCTISFKACLRSFQNNHENLKKEQDSYTGYKPLPMVNQVNNGMVQKIICK